MKASHGNLIALLLLAFKCAAAMEVVLSDPSKLMPFTHLFYHLFFGKNADHLDRFC